VNKSTPLNVLPADQSPDQRPWYADGLRFTCTQCGNCCSGPPGHVMISRDEIALLAQSLKLTVEDTISQYCIWIGDELSLRERRNPQGQFDCIFLDTHPGGKRTCSIYNVRPEQCRTWPFWEGNLASRENWERSAIRCHGMNHGKHYSADEIAVALLNDVKPAV